MATPRFEVPSGAINGVNRVFVVSRSYQSGTTAVFVDGVFLQRDLSNGWFETDSFDGVITFKIAPLSGSAIQVFFTDVDPDIRNELSFISGTIDDMPEISASLMENDLLVAVVS